MAAGTTITQRIALEGAEAIKAQFDSLGKAGSEAFKKIQDAAGANVQLDKISGGLDGVKESLSEVGKAGKKFGDDFSNLGKSVVSTAETFLAVGAAVTAVVAGFGLLVKGAAEAADEIKRTAQSIGLTTDQFQQLRFAAIASNISADQLTGNITKLDRAMGETKKKTLEQAQAQSKLLSEFQAGKLSVAQYNAKQEELNQKANDNITAFTRLGIAVTNGDGSLRDQTAVLEDLADQFKKMPDGAEKTALALELFGRSGRTMIPFLNEGSEGLKKFREEQERLAPALTATEIAVGEKLDKSFNLLGLAVESAKNHFLLAFAPAITSLVEAFTEVIAQNRDTFVELATTVANTVKPVLDDIANVIKGNDKDVNSGFILAARDAFLVLRDVAKGTFIILSEVFRGLSIILQPVADAINALFGTELTGKMLVIIGIIAELTGTFTLLFNVVKTAISGFQLLSVAGAAAFGPAGPILLGIGLAIAAVVALGALFPDVRDKLIAAFVDLPKTLGDFFTEIVDGMVQKFSDGIEAIKKFFSDLADAALKNLRDIGDKISKLFGGGADTGNGGDVPQFASGGHVRGPGTATSDSIWARLSDGEFVNKTRAVRHYGLDFMQAINSMRIPLSSVRALMGGVDMGGLTSSLRPRFAFADGGLAIAGGAAGATQPVNINLNGHTVPAFMSGDAIGNLRKFAVSSQMRSMGRKPSWFQG